MPTVIIDGNEVHLERDEHLNGIQAARRAGIEIPYYCWHPALSVVASCRMCLVEAGRRDPHTGQVSLLPKLVPACQTPATDGTVFVTNSDKVRRARAMVEEDLLIRHPIDCPICDKAGECYLQDYHFQHGQPQRRADVKPFTSRRRPLGDTVTLFVDRCIMCSRCVRFTREITGTNELMVVNRGSHEEIDVFPGYPLANQLSGNVVDLCPVGALADTDFLYSQRVWFMKSHAGVCAGCAAGCSIWVEENQDHIYRLKPRENPHVNGHWMCDEGRYGFRHVHDPSRQTQPRRRGADGQLASRGWSELISEIDAELKQAGRLAAILSPHLTVEEAYLLCRYIQAIDDEALLALGPVPCKGQRIMFPSGFTIEAEKAPNRRGVELVLMHCYGPVLSFDDFLAGLPQVSPGGVWLSGGYKTDWNDQTTVATLDAIPLRIVHDLFCSPLWDAATYQLPGLAFAERSGSYVNHTDQLQSFDWCVRPPAGVLPEGQLFWQLGGRPGLYQPAEILQEMAREIPAFADAAKGVPPTGVDLKVSQLAGV
jgi:NADH-quinone oxidoreductase subunit G